MHGTGKPAKPMFRGYISSKPDYFLQDLPAEKQHSASQAAAGRARDAAGTQAAPA
jgi:hypothetical protein